MQDMQETAVRSLGGEDPLEEEMATNSGILAWEFNACLMPSLLMDTVSKFCMVGINLIHCCMPGTQLST